MNRSLKKVSALNQSTKKIQKPKTAIEVFRDYEKDNRFFPEIVVSMQVSHLDSTKTLISKVIRVANPVKAARLYDRCISKLK